MTASQSDRREFLKVGAAAAAVAAVPAAVHAAGNSQIKVGLIGCGGRGSGAARDCVTADKSVVIHAVGDVFEARAKGAAKTFSDKFGEQANIGDRIYSGLDAYKQVLASGVDLVILATPPGFRPDHLEAAINAKKHVFCEKPVAVDAAGIRKCLGLVEKVKANGTALVAGTQRRHDPGYVETIKRIQGGDIGEIAYARCSWNGDGIWFHARKEGESDVEYQLRNWYHFLWLCGDHIVEQHVHNLDVINWVMGAHPVKAYGFGGRAYRKEGDPNVVGQIWDHFAIEFEYPNGVPVYSSCTHIPGIKTDISETVYGTKGNSRVGSYQINKKKVAEGGPVSPYVQEHIDLIQSIKNGKPLNELEAVTNSTMTAILGRMACYSGQPLTWEQALNANEETMPHDLALSMGHKIGPVPLPGKYKVTKKS